MHNVMTNHHAILKMRVTLSDICFMKFTLNAKWRKR